MGLSVLAAEGEEAGGGTNLCWLRKVRGQG